MKKFLSLLVFSLLAFSCVVFSSCTQDKDENNGENGQTVTQLHYASAHCNGVCDKCGKTMYVGNMSYELSENLNYYIVSGDDLEGDIVLPAYYKGTGDNDYLPVLEAKMLNGDKLSSITYHKNIEAAQPGIAPNLTKIMVDSTNPILKEQDGVLFSDKGKKLIWYPALCEKTSYTIPSDCEEVGSRSFSHITKLQHLTVPQSVEIVGASFLFMSTIDYVEILCPVEKLYFLDSEFREIKIENIQNFPYFGYMQLLEKASVKGTYENIESSSFYNCVNLRELELSNSYKKIGLEAFQNCTSLKSFIIPASVTEIEERAFKESGLTQIECLANIETIPYGAFADCTGLTEFTIPATVKKLISMLFQDARG